MNQLLSTYQGRPPPLSATGVHVYFSNTCKAFIRMIYTRTARPSSDCTLHLNEAIECTSTFFSHRFQSESSIAGLFVET